MEKTRLDQAQRGQRNQSEMEALPPTAMPRKPPKTSGIGSIDAESRPRVGGVVRVMGFGLGSHAGIANRDFFSIRARAREG